MKVTSPHKNLPLNRGCELIFLIAVWKMEIAYICVANVDILLDIAGFIYSQVGIAKQNVRYPSFSKKYNGIVFFILYKVL